ncbi:MAG: hypothetical protein ABIO40_01995 [Devosia sp.]
MPPLKTIAIAPTRKPAHRKRDAGGGLADAVATMPAQVRNAPSRGTLEQPTHRYHVGERLSMSGGGYSISRAVAACKVIALLPYEGRGQLQYRVRSDSEQFERVVVEGDLTR